jgi:hypothetical protein
LVIFCKARVTKIALLKTRQHAYLNSTGSPRIKIQEDTMKFAHRAAVAAVCAAFALAPAASASGLNDCIHMAKQVSSALASAQPGSTTDQARSLAAAGQNACMTSAYAKGLSHYAKALQLLGKA